MIELVEFNPDSNQYEQGYRFVKAIQYGKSYVYKTEIGAEWGSGVYTLNSDNTIGKCVDWNYDSSG